MKKWHYQRGMTAIGWMLVLGLIAFFALITLRLVPIYLEYGKVAATIESLEKEPGITRKTRPEIVKMIDKRFDINDVRGVKAKDVKITKSKGVMTVRMEYQRREHLVGNIDIVASFDKQIELVAN